MTLSEFKAWFGGFTENITKLPTQKQWARIQERVEEIDSAENVIGLRYSRRPWWPEWYIQPYTLPGMTSNPGIEITWRDTMTSHHGTSFLASAANIGKLEAQGL